MKYSCTRKRKANKNSFIDKFKGFRTAAPKNTSKKIYE
jgi:hypothetical protein